MRGGAKDPDAAGGVLDDRQDVLAPAGQGDRLDEVARQQRVGLRMKEVSPRGGAAIGCGVDLLSFEDLPYGGRGNLDAEGGEFPAHPAVAPRRVLPDKAQDQNTDRADGRWPPGSPRSAGAGVALLHQIALPSQRGVRADQQSQPAQDLARQRGKERGEEGAVLRTELDLVCTEQPFKDGDLVTQDEDFRVLARSVIGSSHRAANALVTVR